MNELRTRMFFASLYYKFLHQGWAVIARAPTYLNVAFPDFSVQYILASFMKTDHVVVRGTAPHASYISLTVYNTYGVPCSSIRLTAAQPFQVTVGQELETPDTALYVIIYRVYQPKRAFVYPMIELNHRPLALMTASAIRANSLALSSTVKDALSARLDLSIATGRPFFLPVHARNTGLFVNPDAVYLISLPSTHKVIRITGILPPKTNKNLCFIGFMACNLRTTETDASIGWDKLPRRYSIFVAYTKTQALRYGYRPDRDTLLLWKAANPVPVVVYREVQKNHTGLFLLTSDSPEAAESVMKPYYPRITHY